MSHLVWPFIASLGGGSPVPWDIPTSGIARGASTFASQPQRRLSAFNRSADGILATVWLCKSPSWCSPLNPSPIVSPRLWSPNAMKSKRSAVWPRVYRTQMPRTDHLPGPACR
ncbi:hypothetical protein LNP74_28160 [Klebsiella pneumoniae subsp. pneumoniae]|nr:hypothetical protein [Klebsiella pneumoniae subsp. pneumoniae]